MSNMQNHLLQFFKIYILSSAQESGDLEVRYRTPVPKVFIFVYSLHIFHFWESKNFLNAGSARLLGWFDVNLKLCVLSAGQYLIIWNK